MTRDLLFNLDQIFFVIFLFLLFAYAFLGLDDLLVDLVYWTKNLRPQKLSKDQLILMNLTPEKRIAIMVASWQEAKVLGSMVKGNLLNLEYQNFDFYLGVYPNDEATLQVAKDLSLMFENVKLVVNSKAGPTSKGQMINEIVNGILQVETASNFTYSAIMIHDCEDVLHSKSLKVVNWLLDDYDFIQLPIFSLPVEKRNLVAGTYMDEFAESHMKDQKVRNLISGSIPSAGVGTAVSRKLVHLRLQDHHGEFLNPGTLTEDYELGVSTYKYKTKSRFALYQFKNSQNKWEFIATRAYFPKVFERSVRQKARWILGIAYQGAENIGWSTQGKQNVFLYRDRKGPLSNSLLLVGNLTFFYFLGRMIAEPTYLLTLKSFLEAYLPQVLVIVLGTLNLLFMLNRLTQRLIFSTWVYGPAIGSLSVLRLFLSNLINAFASGRATYQLLESKITGAAPKWVKTEHEMPIGFGQEIRIEIRAGFKESPPEHKYVK